MRWADGQGTDQEVRWADEQGTEEVRWAEEQGTEEVKWPDGQGTEGVNWTDAQTTQESVQIRRGLLRAPLDHLLLRSLSFQARPSCSPAFGF